MEDDSHTLKPKDVWETLEIDSPKNLYLFDTFLTQKYPNSVQVLNKQIQQHMHRNRLHDKDYYLYIY